MIETLIKKHQKDFDSISTELKNITRLQEIINSLEKEKLEKSYNIDSQDAEMADRIRNIQIIFDKIKDFHKERNFSRAFNAIYCIIEEISYIKDHGYLAEVPSEIFRYIDTILKDDIQSLNTLEDSYVNFHDVASSGKELSKKDFEVLAENLEIFAEKIEEHIEVLSFCICEDLEKLLEKIVLFSRVKSGTNDRRERFRRRTRFAAVFILNLIDNLREEAEIENNEVIKDFAFVSHFED